VRTTNPIESTFATIRLRHRRTKGSGMVIGAQKGPTSVQKSARRMDPP